MELFPGRDQEEVKKEWAVLRTIFNREAAREQASKVSGAGTNSVYTSQWWHFKALTFIKGADDVDPPVSTLAGQAHNGEGTPPAKKQKKSASERARELENTKMELFKEALKCLQTPLPVVGENPAASNTSLNDEISLFTKSVESTLRRFPGRQLALARKRIGDVLFELEMELFPQESAASTLTNLSAARTVQRQQFSDDSAGSNVPLNTNNFNWPYSSGF